MTSTRLLDYSFPQPRNLSFSYYDNVQREALLAETLNLRDAPMPTPPTFSNNPISKKFVTTKERKDPLHDIIAASKKIVSDYKLVLEFEQLQQMEQQKTPAKAVHKKLTTTATTTSSIIDTPSRGQKRTRVTNGSTPAPAVTEDVVISSAETPLPIKSFYFSPSGSITKKPSQIHLSSTPTAASNTRPGLHKKPSLQRLLRTDIAFMSDFKPTSSSPQASTPVRSSVPSQFTQRKVEEEDEGANESSSYDQLACHADNIMRMAVDSTLLGSSYNASIMSNFSSSGVIGPNDSLNGVLSRRKAPLDFCFDENDPEKSLLELKKSRWNNLSRDKATKIEINAEDINKILGEI